MLPTLTGVGLPEEARGQTLPYLLGHLQDAPAVPLLTGLVDKLGAVMTATDPPNGGGIVLSSLAVLRRLPDAGRIQIGGERLTYSGKNLATLELRNIGRGADGSTAAAHGVGARVDQWVPRHVYAIGVNTLTGHVTKAVHAIRFEGRLKAAKDPPEHTVTLDDRTSLPGWSLVTVTFDMTTLPFEGEGGLSGTPAGWGWINGQLVPLAWLIAAGAAALLRALGHEVPEADLVPLLPIVLKFMGGPPSPIQIKSSGGGGGGGSLSKPTLSPPRLPPPPPPPAVTPPPRPPSTTTTGPAEDPESPVVTLREFPPPLVGGRVSADVDGLQDTDDGRITGTALTLLERPCHVTRFAMRELYSITGDVYDEATWTATHTDQVAAGLTWGVRLGPLAFSEFARLASLQGRADLFYERARWAYRYRKRRAAVHTLTARNLEGQPTYRPIPITDVVTRLKVRYGLDANQDLAVFSPLGIARHEEQPRDLALPWVQVEAVAVWLADYWLSQWDRQRFLASARTTWEALHLRLGDVLTIDRPYVSTFGVESVRWQVRRLSYPVNRVDLVLAEDEAPGGELVSGYTVAVGTTGSAQATSPQRRLSSGYSVFSDAGDGYAPDYSLVIPLARRIAWSAGLDPEGGIDTSGWTVTAIAGLTYDGSVDGTAIINAAIAGAAADTVLTIGAGRVRIDGNLVMKSRVVLRGAGVGYPWMPTAPAGGHTQLELSSARITFPGGSKAANWPAGADTQINITAGFTTGSTSLTLADASTLSVGDYIAIFEENNPDLVDTQGHDASPNDYLGEDLSGGGGKRAKQQYAKVTAKPGGNVITIDPPLYLATEGFTGAGVRLQTFGVALAGLEDLKVKGDGTDRIITMDFVRHCRVKNVETYNAGNAANESHVWLAFSYGCEIRTSYLHHGAGYGGGANYGVQFQHWNSRHKIEANIIRETRHAIVDGGASGCAVLYNWMDDSHEGPSPSFLTTDGAVNHAAWPHMNLWEGNSGQRFRADFVHGTSGFNTLFRNHGRGHRTLAYSLSSRVAFDIGPFQRYYNLIANVAGMPTWTGGEAIDDGGSSTKPVAFQFGRHTNNAYEDTEAFDSAILHRNYDYVTDGVTLDQSSGTVPPSLYYDAEPSGWPASLVWPPIGWDVDGIVTEIPAQKGYRTNTMPEDVT